MKNILAVLERELKSYLGSPIFYIIGAVFMVVVGNSFKDMYFSFASQSMRVMKMAVAYNQTNLPVMNVNDVASSFFSFLNFIFMLIIPLLTMRLYSEEIKNGTMELLKTSPITTTQVLLGKFFSCFIIYFFLIILTVAFQIIMMIQSKGNLDWGLVLSGYLGTLLFGSTLIAIGIFFSSLTENQIIAATVTMAAILGFWFLMVSAKYMKAPLSDIMTYTSIASHLDTFSYGLIEIRNVVYFLSMTVFWLLITGMNVESTRWRQ